MVLKVKGGSLSGFKVWGENFDSDDSPARKKRTYFDLLKQKALCFLHMIWSKIVHIDDSAFMDSLVY